MYIQYMPVIFGGIPHSDFISVSWYGTESFKQDVILFI